MPGPVVLVGHSYGGMVISAASANAPNVKALVYVDAYIPEPGESIESENKAFGVTSPPDFAIAVPIAGAPAGDVDLYINPKYFGAIFASAESPADALVGWKTIPSWYVLGEADKVIPPAMQLQFATRAKSKVYRVPGGDHPNMIAHPDVTVAAIRDAVNAISH